MEKEFIILPVAWGELRTLLEGSTRHSRHYENVIAVLFIVLRDVRAMLGGHIGSFRCYENVIIILLLYSHMCIPAPSHWVEGLPPPDPEGQFGRRPRGIVRKKS